MSSPTRGPTRGPGLALLVVVALLAAILGVAEGVGSSAVAPRERSIAPTAAPVVGARLVCPDVVGRQVGQISRISRVGVGVPPTDVPGSGGPGTVTVQQLSKLGTPAKPIGTLSKRGTALAFAGQGYQGDVVVDATGSLAPGLSADLFDRRDGGTYRGIDGVACTAPTGEAWALGASTSIGAHGELRLTNTDDLPALVDVTMFGPKGPINAPTALGLAVAPRSTRTVALEAVAPDEKLLLVRVQARSGRVATAVRVQSQSASTPQGVDWLPLAAAPATTAVVPGVAAGKGPRRLVVANPGDTDATAAVTVVAGSGSFVPRGLSTVTVPAGSVISLDLATALGGHSGGVVVSADRPIVAAASMSTGPYVNGYAETAWTAAVPALRGPATTIINYIRSRFSVLLLSAPKGAATVRLTTLGSFSPQPPRVKTVTVPAGRTVGLDLATLAPDAFGGVFIGLTVTPAEGSGPVYAARETFEYGSRSPLLTVTPLRSAPESRPVRPAVANPRAALPD